MIVLVGGEKGGTGKSTLATNIAVALEAQGKDVLLLDADPGQWTASNWQSEREAQRRDAKLENRIFAAQRRGNIEETARDFGQRYGAVVVDAGGRDSEELRSGILAADIFISPFKASQSDLWTADKVGEIVKRASAWNKNLRAFAVISMASPNPRVNEAKDAAGMFASFDCMTLCQTVVRDRKSFRDAMLEGKGVLELADEKAADELNALLKEVL